MNESSTRVADYRLTAPAVIETISKLERSLGSQRAAVLWAMACAHAQCAHDGQHTIDDLIAIGQYLGKSPGIVSVYGSSLAIRARSFRLLSPKTKF